MAASLKFLQWECSSPNYNGSGPADAEDGAPLPCTSCGSPINPQLPQQIGSNLSTKGQWISDPWILGSTTHKSPQSYGHQIQHLPDPGARVLELGQKSQILNPAWWEEHWKRGNRGSLNGWFESFHSVASECSTMMTDKLSATVCRIQNPRDGYMRTRRRMTGLSNRGESMLSYSMLCYGNEQLTINHWSLNNKASRGTQLLESPYFTPQHVYSMLSQVACRCAMRMTSVALEWG